VLYPVVVCRVSCHVAVGDVASGSRVRKERGSGVRHRQVVCRHCVRRGCSHVMVWPCDRLGEVSKETMTTNDD
jgi:hypothetical protein